MKIWDILQCLSLKSISSLLNTRFIQILLLEMKKCRDEKCIKSFVIENLCAQ